MARLFRIWCVVAGLVAAAASGAAPTVETLQLYNRDITELRAVVGGLSPVEREARAQRRFGALTAAELGQSVTQEPFEAPGQRGITLQVAGRPIVTLLEADLDPEARVPLAAEAERAARQVQLALQARKAQAQPTQWVFGAAVALGVVATWVLVAWATLRLHRWLETSRPAQDDEVAPAILRVLWQRATAGLLWLVALALWFAGGVVLLEAFPWSEPWGDRLLAVVQHLGGWFATGTMAAVPGLLAVMLIVLVARAVQDVLSVFMQQVQSGRIRVPFLHADTVGATRRLMSVLVWVLALALAYPYLPGSDTDAFKGLSVLLGLTVTLGSTGLVTQLMSGLVVVYSRSLRRGDYIAINGLEGVVTEVGALAVKVATMRNEEITVPNAVITASPIHNYSKLAGRQGTLVSTRITIGYDAPWRQVHAMLVAAAAATEGVRADPPPRVHQRALGDFYVEYELFVHIDQPLQRVAIVSALHAAIQDEFNRHGVQIMSPHFIDQPAQPVVVPPAKWWQPPARPPAG